MFIYFYISICLLAMPRPAKIKQDQARSTKGTPRINLQAPHAKTLHKTLGPKIEGAVVSRHMAFSIMRRTHVEYTSMY